MTVRPRRIGHIGLISRDLDRLVAWYEEVLGFQVSDRMPYPEDHPFYEGVWMRCNSDHHVLSAFGLRETPSPSGDPRAMNVPGFHHVAYEMESFEDLRRIASDQEHRPPPAVLDELPSVLDGSAARHDIAEEHRPVDHREAFAELRSGA